MRNPTMRELGLMGAKGDLGKKIFNQIEMPEMEEETYEEDEQFIGDIISPADIVDAIYGNQSEFGLDTGKMKFIADKMQEAEEERDEWGWLDNLEEEEETKEHEMSEGEDWSFLDGIDGEMNLGQEEQKGLINQSVKRNKGNTGKTPASNHSGAVPVADKKISTPKVGRTYVDVKLDNDKYEIDGDVIDEEELEIW